MLYRLVRAVHRAYALTVFWIYVAMFVIAFCFTFVLPIVPIVLLFVAIFGLAFAAGGAKCLELVENALARARLRRQICPRCEHAGAVPVGGSERIRCPNCAAVFERWGGEAEEVDVAEVRATPAM